MWLIVSLIASLAASFSYLLFPSSRKKFRLGLLSLMLWGTTIMVLIDHAIAYLSGDEFLSSTTDGMISDSILLGIAMLIPILAIWAIATFTPFGRRMAE